MGRARVLQRRGRAGVQEIERWPKSCQWKPNVLVHWKQNPVTRKTLEVYAASVREFLRLERLVGRQRCGGFGSGQTSHRVHGLAFFFTGPPGLDRREIVGKRPLLLSNFLEAGGESTGSELPSPQMMETGVPSLSRRPSSQQSGPP